MAAPVTVPRLGWTMDEGTFVEWLKHDGESVQPGQTLFVLESEKATENIEALDGGILRLLPGGPQPGDKVKVGQVLAYLVAEGEATPAGTEYSVISTQSAEFAEPPPSRMVAAVKPARAPERRKTVASPRARRVAKELGIDWNDLQGSGRNGRVRERDVRAAASRGGRLIPHTNVRKVIAARMVAGVTQAAPATLTTRADATDLVTFRDQFRGEVKPSYTDLLLKLT